MFKELKCIICGRASLGWFCEHHHKIKELVYKEAREKGLDNYWDIMALRDKRLNEKLNKS